MSILSDADILSLRTSFEGLLVHTCTVTPLVAGAEDPEGTIPYTLGTPVTGVPCTYGTISRVVRDEGGPTLVSVPTLTVSATAPIVIGSQVTAVLDQLDVVLAAGPLRVERLLDDTAGLGAPLLPTYELRGGRVST